MKVSTLVEPALIGRENELAQLKRFLDLSKKGQGSTIFISGEAGSGKTRLTKEFLIAAKTKGVAILSGWCLSNAAVPYFPFSEAISSSHAESTIDNSDVSQHLGLKSWLLESSQTAEKRISPEALKEQRFASMAKELLYLSTSSPLILFIDDLHWADSASLALLHYLARVIRTEKILILATFRTEELGVSFEGFAHPLVETLRLLSREDLFNEIKLTNLNRFNVNKIAESMLRGKVHDALVDRISDESQGNPLFIIESLKLLFENDSLVREGDEWRLNVDRLSIPIKIKDIILRRLSTLKLNQRRILDVASVIGDKFDPQLLGSVLEVDSLSVLETLNSIALSRSLVCVEGDYYKFDHAKTREVLYEEILLPLRKGYHQRVAERIESLNADKTQLPVADLAYHYTRAGNIVKSIKFSNTAGKEALARFSYAEAIKYFSYVLEALPQDTDNPEWQITALEGLGDAFYSSMMFKDAIKTYETLAQFPGEAKLRALRKAMEASFFQNDLTHLQQLLKQADETISSDRLETARVLMNKGRVCTLQGNQMLGLESRRKALQVFEEEYSLWDTAWCLISVGTNLPTSGKFEESVSALLRSISIFRELKDSRWLIEAYNMAGICLGVFFGFPKEGRALVEESIKINDETKIGDYLRLSQSNAIESWFDSASGDLQGAIAKSLKALTLAQKTDSYWAKGMAYANLTTYYTLIQQDKLAEEYFGQLMKLPSEVRLNAMVNAPLASAMYLASKEQFEKSNEVFNGILTYFKTNPNVGAETGIKMSYAWALSKQGRLEDGKKQIMEAQAVQEEMAKKFANCNVYATLMAPIKVQGNQAFEIRLDLVNVSKAEGSLEKIDHLLDPELKILSWSPNAEIENNQLKFKETKIDPFSIVTIKLMVQAPNSGTFVLSPIIHFRTDDGEAKITQPKLLRLSVANLGVEETKIEFDSEISRKVFDLLAGAFNKDYIKLGLTQEASGWRTLMDIVKEGGIPKNQFYTSSGGHGQLIADLKRRGLIELRIFGGERGRGGKIMKVRVAYQKEDVKRFIERRQA